MVNTRRKSHAPTSEESNLQAAEQSDSSNTSTTRRSTRRSVGTIQPPKEVSTPTRRSRRLSNSSVESINNDTPRPATRRSTRNKTAGSDSETNDVELVVIKRRKIVEGVDTLVPICEEKNEVEKPSQPNGTENNKVITLDNETPQDANKSIEKAEIGIIDVPKIGFEETVNLVDEKEETSQLTCLKEDIMNTSETKKQLNAGNIGKSPCKDIDSTTIDNAKVEATLSLSPTKHLDEKKMSEEKKQLNADSIEKSPCKDIDSTATDNAKVEAALSLSPTKHLDEKKTSEDKKQLNADSIGKSPCKDIDSTTSDNAIVEATLSLSPTKCLDKIDNSTIEDTCIDNQNEESKSLKSEPINDTNNVTKVNSPVKTVEEKSSLLFGVPSNLITVSKTLNLAKLEKKKKTTRKVKKVEKKVEIKPTLPCGADVMRNIPRGKSKSGREWKEPKSNPRYMYQDKGLKMPFEKITQLRQERKRVKDLENRMKEEERARRTEINRRREINKKREEENARRGEVVQVIRNTNKIKRMKKKQLKLIQKRDTTKIE